MSPQGLLGVSPLRQATVHMHRHGNHAHVHPTGESTRPSRNTGRACNCPFVDIDELGQAGNGAQGADHFEIKWQPPHGSAEIGIGIAQGALGCVSMYFGAQNFRAAGVHLQRYKAETRDAHEKWDSAHRDLQDKRARDISGISHHDRYLASNVARNAAAHEDILERAIHLQRFSRWAAGALPFVTGALMIAGMFFPPLAAAALGCTALYCLLHVIRYVRTEIPEHRLPDTSGEVRETDRVALNGLKAVDDIHRKRSRYFGITAVAFGVGGTGACIAVGGMIAALTMASPGGVATVLVVGAVIAAAGLLVTVYTNNSRVLKDAGTRTDQGFGLERENMGSSASIRRAIGYWQDEEERCQQLKRELRAEGLTWQQRAKNRLYGIAHGISQIVPFVNGFAHRRQRHLVRHANDMLATKIMVYLRDSEQARLTYLTEEYAAQIRQFKRDVGRNASAHHNEARDLRALKEKCDVANARVLALNALPNNTTDIARALWDTLSERGEHGYPVAQLLEKSKILAAVGRLGLLQEGEHHRDTFNFDPLLVMDSEDPHTILNHFFRAAAIHLMDGYRAEISYRKLAHVDQYRARIRLRAQWPLRSGQ